MTGRESLFSLDLLALGEGYPSSGKLLVEKAPFRADADDGFLAAIIEKADSRPYKLFNIEESIATTIELVAHGECLHCVRLSNVNLGDSIWVSLYTCFILFFRCSLTTVHCVLTGHAAPVEPDYVEDYLRSLASNKEPKVSTPSAKPAFVSSIDALGQRFFISRITIICIFDGPVCHWPLGYSHATNTSPPPKNYVSTADPPMTEENSDAQVPSAGAMATTVTGATTRVPTSIVVTGATTTTTLLPKASRRVPLNMDTVLARLNVKAGTASKEEIEDGVMHLKHAHNTLLNRAGGYGLNEMYCYLAALPIICSNLRTLS